MVDVTLNTTEIATTITNGNEVDVTLNNTSIPVTINTGGIADHGLLNGLGDDDHPHYLNQARGDALYAALSHNHNDIYYTESEVDTLLNAKQATLVSGTNIKTINGTSLLGSGDIVITSGVSSVNSLTGDVNIIAGTNIDSVVTSGTDITINAANQVTNPAGSDGQIQFNDSGAFGAESNLYWDKTNDRLGVGTSSPSYPVHIVDDASTAHGTASGLVVENDTIYNVNAISTSTSTGKGNANYGFLVDGVVKGIMGYNRTDEYIGWVNGAYSLSQFALRLNSDGSLAFHDGATATNRLYLTKDGLMGVGNAVTNPQAVIHAQSTTEQFRLAYDSSNYWTDIIAADGGRTIAGFGTDADLNLDFSGATDGDFSVNSDDLFVDTSTGQVGINTTTPTADLMIESSGTGSTDDAFRVQDSSGSNIFSIYGNGTLTMDKDIDLGSVSGGLSFFAIGGSDGIINFDNDGSDYLSTASFLAGELQLRGASKITNSRGLSFVLSSRNSNVNNAMLGMLGSAYLKSPGRANSLTGAQFSVISEANGGTVANAVGNMIRIQMSSASSTWTTTKGLSIDLVTGSGTFTQLYGIYVDDMKSLGTHTNDPYGLYVLGSAVDNYIAGQTGFGQSRPDTKIHVTATDGTGAITLDEESTTPSNPSSSDQARVYVKDNKFIVQWNDGGTVRYKYLDLTGTGVTWTHTTTAP